MISGIIFLGILLLILFVLTASFVALIIPRFRDTLHNLIRKMFGLRFVLTGIAILSIFLLALSAYMAPHVIQNWGRYHSARDVFDHIDWCFEDYTLYAPSYTESEFSKIEIGMSQDQVLSLIGEPLKKLDSHWFYTQRKKSDSNYWSRVVEFDSDKRVIRISKFYNVD